MATDPTSLFTIDGTVIDSEGAGSPGVRVIATDVIDATQPRPRVLISTTTDADGSFSLSLSSEDALRLFRTGVDQENGQPSRPMVSQGRTLALVAYSRGAVVGRQDLPITLDGLADGYDVRIVTTRFGETLAMARGPHQVTGILRDEAGRPVAGTPVEVLHVRLRDEVVLASETSGSDGSFRLSYDASAHLGEASRALAVAVRALQDDGTGTLVEKVRSDRVCPAPALLEVELTLPQGATAGTEIERIGPTINARRETVAWAELTDDDVELISGETGLSLSEVSLYARAARLAETSGLPVEALYALGRRGMTMSVAAIGALPPSVVQRELEGAALQGLVPGWTDVGAVASQMSSVMGTRAAADDDEAPLGQLLAAVGLPAAVRESFVVGYVGRTGTVEEFWADFAGSHTAEEVARTRFSLTTGALTQGHLPLVVALEAQRQSGELSSERDLAAMTMAQWQELVSGHGATPGTGAPQNYPGEDDAERELLYATALARAAEETFPTAALVKRTAATGRWSLASSYVDAHPELDFRTANARTFLSDHPPTGLTTEQEEALRTELSQAQRLFMVAPRFDRDVVAGALLDAGLHSAHQIVGMGPSAFAERHGEALGSEAIAKVVYDNAHHVTSTLTVMAMKHGAPFNPMSLPSIGNHTADPGDAPPDLEHLLGSMDYCACEHCRSVLSPAAYLVELLRFLEQRPAIADEGGGAAVAPFGALAARRPDLLHTLLDCANTNTPLPTIDLVNEILEQQVVGAPPPTWPQTTRTAQELRAQPEHRIDEAYDTLRTAVFPWALPFDLARAETDAFLGHLGVSRVELLQACGAPSAGLDDAIAHARLGLESVAAQLIAGDSQGHPPYDLWGVDSTEWFGALTDAPLLLERAGLDLAGFEALAATTYVGAGLLGITFANSCRLEGATIDGLDEERLGRMHRFLRLQRALGWSMAEVDAAIASLGSAGVDPLDAECVRALSRAVSLTGAFDGLSRDEWLAWFGDLPTSPRFGEERSQYDEIFVPRTAQGEVGPLSPAELSGTIIDLAPHVTAALSITEEELALLLSIDPARAPATVANLSWLMRWSSLVRAVGLTVRDAVTLTQISGVVPFQTTGASGLDVLEHYIEQARAVLRSGVPLARLDALLRHRGPDPVSVPEAELAGILVELVRGLQAVHNELEPFVEPSGSARAMLPEQLARVMVEDELGPLLERVSYLPTESPLGDYEPRPSSAVAFLSEATWNSLQDLPLEGSPLADPEHRATLVLNELVVHLRSWLSEGVVVNKLAATMGLSAGAVGALLEVDDGGSPMLMRFIGESHGLATAIDFSTQGAALADPHLPKYLAVGAGGFPSLAPQLEALRWLAKSVTLIEQLGLGDDDLRWLLGHGSAHGLLSPADIPTEDPGTDPARWSAWRDLQRFARFARAHTAGLADLREVFDADTDPRGVLARVTGWEDPSLDPLDSSIAAIAAQRGLEDADLRTLEGLEQIARALEVAKQLGVAPTRAIAWSAEAPTTALARDIQAAAKAKVSSEAWPRVLGPLRDGLRKRQRDALVAYVLAADAEVSTSEDLFGRLLIDVEISPCASTSRIKQAISSVQTFVQRVLLSKEAGVNLSAAATTEWQWMSRYRVWEANRKIFLWPENWLQPELRDDKTELFEALQSALLDGELDDDVAEAAVSKYLKGLAEIARLHVAGMVHEKEVAEANAIAVDRLHVFARTKTKPYRYFHRIREDRSEWSPWKELPFTINAESVLPAIVRKRLVLGWITVQDRSKGDTEALPREYHELRLSWCVHDHEGWGQVRTASRTASDMGVQVAGWVEAPGGGAPAPIAVRAESASTLFYRVRAGNDGSLSIAPGFPALGNDWFGFPGRFRFSDIEDEPAIVSTPAGERTRRSTFNHHHVDWRPRPAAMIPRQQWYVMDTKSFDLSDIREFGLQLPVRSMTSGAYSYQKVLDTPHAFTLSAPTQHEEFSSESPMIFQDSRRSLCIDPRAPVANMYLAWSDTSGPSLEGLGGLAHAAYVPSRTMAEDLLGGAPEASDIQNDLVLTDPQQTTPADPTALESWEKWTFDVAAFDHPLASRLVDLVRRHGVQALYRPPTEGRWASFARQRVRENRNELYGLGLPTNAARGSVVDELDFSAAGSYSVYNWELFFHAPMLVALRLKEDKKFEQARRWMHNVFDPTAGGTAPTPSRYWQVGPLFESTVTDVTEQLEALHYEGSDSGKKKQRDDTRDQIARWRRNPFRPHSLARLRVSAYQRWVVMRYLDNLIEWGDHLFSQDTMESNNEALQLYIMAAQLLGPRPVMLPERDAAAMSYADVQGAFDEFSNFLAPGENAIAAAMANGAASVASAGVPQDIHPVQGAYESAQDGQLPVSAHSISLARMVGYSFAPPSGDEAPALYFCVPHNQELLRYWDVVADRLFKLRHCMNIEGVERQLPLFQPPLDPGLLAKAAANGVDVSAALSDIGAPRPHYRFSTMLSLAKELAAEVRGFGSSLADALRSADTEALAELRATQEAELLSTLRQVREQRIEEAQQAIVTLERAKDIAVQRRDYYESLPTLHLAEESDSDSEDLGRSAKEAKQIDDLVRSKIAQSSSKAFDLMAAFLGLIPQFDFGVSVGPHIVSGFGGQQLALPSRMDSIIASDIAQWQQSEATIAGLEAGYERRLDDWDYQVEQAAAEIARIEQDILVARLRLDIAKRELSDHDAQVANAQHVDAYLRDRYTNAELYRWLGSELSRSYFHAYQLAFEIAKQAQRCYQYELGISQASFIEFGYWDNRRKGLLAGERLLHDLRRMETSYLANNRREYELSKRVSLARIDPFALLRLRTEGSCDIHLPEALFELDHPSHYMRRIRSVRVSIIGNTGPYDTVGATLTLTRSEVRTSTSSYSDPDQPVVETGGATQSIATSTGSSDAGLFEANLRDERYLPFEGRGAASRWSLSLPKALRTFDYGDIADVVLEMQYTAREGGQVFAAQVEGEQGVSLRARLDAAGLGSGAYGTGRMWGWSAAARFPQAWSALRQPAPGDPHTLSLPLEGEHYPQPLSGSSLTVQDVFVIVDGGGIPNGTTVTVTSPGGIVTMGGLQEDPNLPGLLVAGRDGDPLPPLGHAATGDWTITLGDVPDPTTLRDLVLIVRYTEGA